MPTAKKSTVKIVPAHDLLLISRNMEKETTPGGIVLPDKAREKENQGIVKAVGPGRKDKDGLHIALDFEPGDVVIFGGYAGNEIEIDGENYLLVRENDILAKLA